MRINEYQELARRTQNTELKIKERQLHALHGMSAEVGEIHAIFQKVYQGHPFDADALAVEIGDLLWFTGELCDTLGVTMEYVCQRNIDKLRARYPKGFEAKRSIERQG